MAKKSIEELLELTKEEIEIRKAELRRTIPTKPGIEYLRKRAKFFEVQPWPFIDYLAHYNPDLLEQALDAYYVYDGGENVQSILEPLREKYIIWEVISDTERK